MRAVTEFFVRSSYPAIAAGASMQYTARLVDQDGVVVPASDLTSFTLSLVDDSGEIVNSVDDIDILNVDRGTVDNNGNVRILLTPADTLLDSGITRAVRSLVMKWGFSLGRQGRHQVNFRIEALVD